MKKLIKNFIIGMIGILFIPIVFAAVQRRSSSTYEISQKRMLFTENGLPTGTGIMDINTGGNIITYGPLQIKKATIINTGNIDGLIINGDIDNYFQLNIKNSSTGQTASSDIVATANNGTETGNYVDLGINGSNYTGLMIGSGNDAYLYSLANNFYLGTYNNKELKFLQSGVNVANIGGNHLFSIEGGATSWSSASGDSRVFETMTAFDSPFVSFGPYQNFLLQSESFGTTWLTGAIANVTNNSSYGPDETLIAEIIPTSATSTGRIFQNITNATTGNRTFSVWLRSNTGTNYNINLAIDSNTESGTILPVLLTNRWKRYAVTQFLTTTHTTKQISIINGTGFISAWAAQLEPTTFARRYGAPTTTAAVTALTFGTYMRQTLTTNSPATIGGALTIVGALAGVTTIANSSTQTTTISATATGHTIGNSLVAGTAATTASRIQNSPTIRFTSNALDLTPTAATKVSAIEIGAYGIPGTGTSTMLYWRNYSKNAVVQPVTGNYLMILDQTGNLCVGNATTGVFNPTNPERLLVNAGITNSYNLIKGIGSINNYLQFNIQNQSIGTNASTDIVATADNGTESINYIDMGINGSNYTAGMIGFGNDAYLYSLANNLYIGTYNQKDISFIVSGNTTTTIDSGGFMTFTGNSMFRQDMPNNQFYVGFTPTNRPALTTIAGLTFEGYCFDGGTQTNEMDGKVEIPHNMYGNVSDLHIHLMPSTAGANTTGVLYVDWGLSGPGKTITTTGTSSIIFNVGNVAWTGFIVDLGDIVWTGKAFGDTIHYRVYRTPTGTDTYPGCILISDVGFHYRANQLGSRSDSSY